MIQQLSRHLDNKQNTIDSPQQPYVQQHKLAPFILLAIIVHIALIAALKFQPNRQIKPPIMFDVSLMPYQAPEKHIEVEPSNTKSDVPLTSIPVKKAQKSQTPTTNKIEIISSTGSQLGNVPNKIDAQPNTEASVATINIAPNANASKPKISTESLLESAHRIAIEDAKTMPKEKNDGIALADRPISPKLALALAPKKRPKPGITSYADGIVKVVNSDGSSYCLQPPPPMPSGIFEPLSIPMTCPN
jgi:hypothetical protein